MSTPLPHEGTQWENYFINQVTFLPTRSNTSEISQENTGNSIERRASFISTPSGGADYSIYLQVLIFPLTNTLLKVYTLLPMKMTHGQYF